MTEQVIDIRDRIEKMRNQITVPGSQTAVQKKKLEPEKEFYKHELECYSRFQENEMENLIPCERCKELISFEEYQNHINFCGYRTPIFFF